MLIVNKQAVKALPHPFVVSAMQVPQSPPSADASAVQRPVLTGPVVQLFASALFAVMLRGLGQVSFPNPTVSKMWGWKGILLAWVVPILLNMKAMRLVSVETMMMFRSVATVAVAAGDTLLLGTELSPRKLFSCVVISLGGLIYAQNDLQFDLAGYIWGGCYALSMVVNTVYIKHSFNQLKDMGIIRPLVLHSPRATSSADIAPAAPRRVGENFPQQPPRNTTRPVPRLRQRGVGNGRAEARDHGDRRSDRRAVVVRNGARHQSERNKMPGNLPRVVPHKRRVLSRADTCWNQDVLTATSFDVLGNCTKARHAPLLPSLRSPALTCFLSRAHTVSHARHELSAWLLDLGRVLYRGSDSPHWLRAVLSGWRAPPERSGRRDRRRQEQNRVRR